MKVKRDLSLGPLRINACFAVIERVSMLGKQLEARRD
jgi:hypothetical protein